MGLLSDFKEELKDNLGIYKENKTILRDRKRSKENFKWILKDQK